MCTYGGGLLSDRCHEQWALGEERGRLTEVPPQAGAERRRRSLPVDPALPSWRFDRSPLLSTVMHGRSVGMVMSDATRHYSRRCMVLRPVATHIVSNQQHVSVYGCVRTEAWREANSVGTRRLYMASGGGLIQSRATASSSCTSGQPEGTVYASGWCSYLKRRRQLV